MPTTDRRQFLTTTAATLGAAALLPSAVARAGTPPGPPVARTVDAVERRFGLTLPDPYRWMEDARDPDWVPYMRAQNAYARATLDRIAGRAALAKRIGELSGETAITVQIQRAGGRVFVQFRPKGADTYKLYVIDTPEAERRLLVDPDIYKTGAAHMALDWWAASPDGSHAVFGISPSGSELSVARVIHVADGRVLPEALDRAPFGGPSWLPDGSGFFLNRLREGAKRGTPDYYKDSAVWLHRIGTDPATDLRVAARGLDAAVTLDGFDLPFVQAAPGSDQVLLVGAGGVRHANPLWTADLAGVVVGRARWRQVCAVSDEITKVALKGRDLYLVTEKATPFGALIHVDATRPDLASAKVVVPEGARPIEEIVAARDGIYLQLMDGGPNRLQRLGNDGGLTDIAMPFDAGIARDGLFASADTDGLDVRMAGWVQPFAIWRYEPTAPRLTDTGFSPPPALDLSPYFTTRLFATAKDGARVPVSIVARRDTPRDGSAPLWMTAYGSYQISTSPAFTPGFIAFLDAGGVMATAHVRGGGEYGRPWWQAGKGPNKHNTWQDAIACAEALCAAKWTSPGRLTLMGTSAGGIMVGRALTERPDLFAGAVDNVGWVNATRCVAEQNGATNFDEFGFPDREADFKALAEMDAYQHVKDGVNYPAVLVVAGMSDPRVAPWHGGKFAARLQKASASGKPVLLRVDFDAGHGLGSTRTQRDLLQADIFAFTLWRAGKPGYQPV